MPRRVLVRDPTLRYHLTTITTILQLINGKFYLFKNLEAAKVNLHSKHDNNSKFVHSKTILDFSEATDDGILGWQ